MVHSETIFIWGRKKKIYLLKSTWSKPLYPNPSCKNINISIGYTANFKVIFYQIKTISVLTQQHHMIHAFGHSQRPCIKSMDPKIISLLCLLYMCQAAAIIRKDMVRCVFGSSPVQALPNLEPYKLKSLKPWLVVAFQIMHVYLQVFFGSKWPMGSIVIYEFWGFILIYEFPSRYLQQFNSRKQIGVY